MAASPGFEVIALLSFESMEAMQAALNAAGAEIVAGIPTFTNVQPVWGPVRAVCRGGPPAPPRSCFMGTRWMGGVLRTPPIRDETAYGWGTRAGCVVGMSWALVFPTHARSAWVNGAPASVYPTDARSTRAMGYPARWDVRHEWGGSEGVLGATTCLL
jgi:hypothetical protein